MLGPLVLRTGLCLWGAEHDSSEELSSSYFPVVQTKIVSSTGIHLPTLFATGPINAAENKKELLNEGGCSSLNRPEGASRQKKNPTQRSIHASSICRNAGISRTDQLILPHTHSNILSKYQAPLFRFCLKMKKLTHLLPGPLQKTLGTGAACKSISPTIFVCPYFMASVRAVAPVLSLTSAFTPYREKKNV